MVRIQVMGSNIPPTKNPIKYSNPKDNILCCNDSNKIILQSITKLLHKKKTTNACNINFITLPL